MKLHLLRLVAISMHQPWETVDEDGHKYIDVSRAPLGAEALLLCMGPVAAFRMHLMLMQYSIAAIAFFFAWSAIKWDAH